MMQISKKKIRDKCILQGKNINLHFISGAPAAPQLPGKFPFL